MNHFDVDYALQSFAVLVDTREQDTLKLRKRLREMGVPYRREKLDFGDYSAACTLRSGAEFSLKDRAAVERKMSFDELCACYGKGRPRFAREFERARQSGAALYLLVENGSWEKAYEGEYRSQMTPQSFVASLTAWLARYRCQLIFCDEKTTGRLIRDLLYREMKEHLARYEAEEEDGATDHTTD